MLSILTLGLLKKDSFEIYFVMPASFIFSTPFVVIIWILATASCMRGNIGEKLYKSVLQFSFFAGIGAAVFFKVLFGKGIGQASIIIAIGIVLSAVSATIIFRKNLKSIV
jgi:hypothetical protein